MEDIRGFVAESWDDIKSPTTSDFTSKIHQLKDLVGNYDQVSVSPTMSYMSCISSWLLGSFGLQAFVIAPTYVDYIHYKKYISIHFFLGGWVTYMHWLHDDTTGKLQNLSEISWFTWVFWLVLVVFVLCCLRASHPWKKCLNSDDLSRQETIGQHFPKNCSKIGHPYEAITNLFGWNIFIPLLSANKTSHVDLKIRWDLDIFSEYHPMVRAFGFRTGSNTHAVGHQRYCPLTVVIFQSPYCQG